MSAQVRASAGDLRATANMLAEVVQVSEQATDQTARRSGSLPRRSRPWRSRPLTWTRRSARSRRRQGMFSPDRKRPTRPAVRTRNGSVADCHGAEHRTDRRDDPDHHGADQSARAERHDRSRSRRRGGSRVLDRRERGQGACRPDSCCRGRDQQADRGRRYEHCGSRERRSRDPRRPGSDRGCCKATSSAIEEQSTATPQSPVPPIAPTPRHARRSRRCPS